jgi:hypothetical protein
MPAPASLTCTTTPVNSWRTNSRAAIFIGDPSMGEASIALSMTLKNTCLI